ncbi:MAG: hypothetical protein IPN94_05410 [Sphingobacteriales bacterium]|nr:hypothetical protein [Sphingobacteriales bacterium]
MSIKNLFVAILLVGTLHSCQNSQTTNEQKQQNTEKALGLDGKGTNIMREAMVIHDEAMQHMSEISQFRSRISTEAAKPKADSKKLKELEAQLAAADQAMLDWMHAFKKPANPEDSIEYLNTKKMEIERAQKLINDAVAAAKQQFGETK